MTISLRAQVGTLQETVSVDRRAEAETGTANVSKNRKRATRRQPACRVRRGQLTPPMKVRDVRPRYGRSG